MSYRTDNPSSSSVASRMLREKPCLRCCPGSGFIALRTGTVAPYGYYCDQSSVRIAGLCTLILFLRDGSRIQTQPSTRMTCLASRQGWAVTRSSGVVPQEILLILEEYWSRNPQLQAVPIYQASGLAAKSMTIYQTYIEMMNEDIRKAFQVRCSSRDCLPAGSRMHPTG